MTIVVQIQGQKPMRLDLSILDAIFIGVCVAAASSFKYYEFHPPSPEDKNLFFNRIVLTTNNEPYPTDLNLATDSLNCKVSWGESLDYSSKDPDDPSCYFDKKQGFCTIINLLGDSNGQYQIEILAKDWSNDRLLYIRPNGEVRDITAFLNSKEKISRFAITSLGNRSHLLIYIENPRHPLPKTIPLAKDWESLIGSLALPGERPISAAVIQLGTAVYDTGSYLHQVEISSLDEPINRPKSLQQTAPGITFSDTFDGHYLYQFLDSKSRYFSHDLVSNPPQHRFMYDKNDLHNDVAQILHRHFKVRCSPYTVEIVATDNQDELQSALILTLYNGYLHVNFVGPRIYFNVALKSTTMSSEFVVLPMTCNIKYSHHFRSFIRQSSETSEDSGLPSTFCRTSQLMPDDFIVIIPLKKMQTSLLDDHEAVIKKNFVIHITLDNKSELAE